MDRPVPDGFIQTHLAIQEYVLDDRGWKQRELLLNGRRGLKDSTKERIRRSENFRLDHLYAHIRAAISKGELVPKVWVKRHAQWYALPPAYWAGTSVDDSLWTGEVIEIDKAIPAKDRALLRDALVCFDRDEWEAWIASRKQRQRTSQSSRPSSRGPTVQQKLVNWLRTSGSKYRNASNKDISDAFKKVDGGTEVSEETIRKARDELGLPPRKKKSAKTAQK